MEGREGAPHGVDQERDLMSGTETVLEARGLTRTFRLGSEEIPQEWKP